MPSKIIWTLALVVCNGLISACTLKPSDDQFLVGKKLENISSVSFREEGDAKKMAIFDKTVKRIHQFDVKKMEHLNSYPVDNTDVPHYVLSDVEGRYIVDLSKRGFTVISTSGGIYKDPVTLLGTPVSAAFRPEMGTLLVYDNLNNVALLKISADGSVSSSQKVLLGSRIVNDANITAGDIADDGKLILGLSDNSIAVVDIDQTLQQKKWVFQNFSTSLQEISWIAPVPEVPNQVLVLSRDAISLVDVQTRTILSKYDIYSDFIRKASKDIDPHVIVASQNKTVMYYVAGGTIKSVSRTLQSYNILASHLDISGDRWSILDTNDSTYTIFNDPNLTDKAKEFKSYRLSDMLALETKSLPEKAYLQISRGFILGLFPSELGYAVRYDLQSDDKKELKYFNMKHIK